MIQAGTAFDRRVREANVPDGFLDASSRRVEHRVRQLVQAFAIDDILEPRQYAVLVLAMHLRCLHQMGVTDSAEVLGARPNRFRCK